MFNDDVQMGFFDVYDQYLLNLLYDPRIRPGMTKKEVDRLMPDLLSTARAWVRERAELRDGSGTKPGHTAAEIERRHGAN